MSESASPLVFGILNVTPDSFSDGGRWLDAGAAIARARELVRLGADVIDVGGESTRPGAERVAAADEQARVIPVVEALSALGVEVSVDTMRASTARAAIAAGARTINDVSGGLADPDMLGVVADSEVRYIAMHWRGHSTEMDALARYTDVAAQVREELAGRLDALVSAGIRRERIVLDPGFGFAKDAAHNWDLLARLEELRALGQPMLVGVSRKRFLADVLPESASVADRDLPTAIASAMCAASGVWGVRVHDVAGTRVALEMARRLSGGRHS
ncbi:MAG TPA: dihydropteroate synthase [Microbacteriaceae bacterium]|nr:dihydropteroate synthase [Microbacteriaceae bacterium]